MPSSPGILTMDNEWKPMAEQAVLSVLPPSSKLVSFGRHGSPNWASGYKVEVEHQCEKKAYYFKVIYHPCHPEIARGEYESQKALQEYLPNNVSIPAAYGTFKDGKTSFFLTPFRDLSLDVPSPPEFAEVVAKLHTTSVSPTGKFGFHITTYVGRVPVINDWCDTWEEWFTRDFREGLAFERSVNGADLHFDELAAEFLKKVVPRLLRPLETGGRSVKPKLLHGELWEVCVYGHNELDACLLSRRPGSQLDRDHLTAYKNLVPPSEPAEDYEDRLTLYLM
ncbi:Fructosamine kinase-domain-containing protein [Coniochaeta sp. 2T2.1]|nr:Fructosamine kinase-domain-containing protein [Coniochaeta sp. 2T2.1]